MPEDGQGRDQLEVGDQARRQLDGAQLGAVAPHPSVPNALAALVLHVRTRRNRLPHVTFQWTEGHPLLNMLRFAVPGAGEVAPVTREVLREAGPDRGRRPRMRVG